MVMKFLPSALMLVAFVLVSVGMAVKGNVGTSSLDLGFLSASVSFSLFDGSCGVFYAGMAFGIISAVLTGVAGIMGLAAAAEKLPSNYMPALKYGEIAAAVSCLVFGVVMLLCFYADCGDASVSDEPNSSLGCGGFLGFAAALLAGVGAGLRMRAAGEYTQV
eukprot:TRINITY_DN1574_c0_g1_i1.p2 TRINITY_DN1574_c0_g1~~TRINITY_DN1574_c0_g1_i1.p2  ORF type:complete len:162 (+),score=47.92 TRINITY_DN1574_c0_g1_i1:74-559(+)